MRTPICQRVWRRGSRGGTTDDGQILIMILGYAVIALVLVVVATDATAVYLARTQLSDAADAAALDAADAADQSSVYGTGVEHDVPLTDASVRAAASSYLVGYLPPTRVQDVRLDDATGSPDGQVAVVQLTATVRLPLLGPVVQAWSGGISVTARSQARADVDRP
ncbi:MAG: pilus assembly protein TadG-related protein [Actinomycetota bacterium]|nr:pilus assembly protein TadG-related protein [Actinomycetota bacterium]